jgi:signal transduction histidine kinase
VEAAAPAGPRDQPVRRRARELPGIYAGGVADRQDTGSEPLAESPTLTIIAVPAVVVTYALVIIALAFHLQNRSPAVIAVATVALLAAVGGTAVAIIDRHGPDARSLAALAVTGLGGALIFGLVPTTPSYLIISIALAGLGMRLRLVPAAITSLAVLAAADLAFVLAPQLSVAGLISQNIGAAFVFSVGAFARAARNAQNESRAAQARAEDLLAQLRASQAAQAEAAALTERARLAREIHDILAHALSGLVLALDTMELLGRQSDADPAALSKIMEQVARSQRIARDGLADTRRAIAALRGDELPGPALLNRLVTETAAATGITAVLTVTGEQRPLAPEIGLALYRTAQETLTNTAKYAGRNGSAELRLSYRDGDIELAVEDARSCDALPPPPGLTFGGYGLTGIRERAELLGGKLTAGPTDHGFKVLLQLPTIHAAGPAGLS